MLKGFVVSTLNKIPQDPSKARFASNTGPMGRLGMSNLITALQGWLKPNKTEEGGSGEISKGRECNWFAQRRKNTDNGH